MPPSPRARGQPPPLPPQPLRAEFGLPLAALSRLAHLECADFFEEIHPLTTL